MGNNSTLIKDDVPAEVARLEEEDLQVIGSGDLAQTLMQHGLVDECRLMINPVVLGTGKRLFRDGNPRTPLRLADSKTSSAGVLIVTYQPAEG